MIERIGSVAFLYLMLWLLACWCGQGKFAWYDMWVGAFWDRREKRLYLCIFGLLIWLD